MQNPPQNIFEYLKTQRTGVLALEMLDGSPHAATLHFAHSENPLIFYFQTHSESRKAEPILNNKITKATFVVGANESEMKTLQIDGIVELIKPEEKEAYTQVYLGKFPEKLEKSNNPKFISFKLTPTWWRFTDFKTPEGKKIWCSEDK